MLSGFEARSKIYLGGVHATGITLERATRMVNGYVYLFGMLTGDDVGGDFDLRIRQFNVCPIILTKCAQLVIYWVNLK
jgi:hypothetical protein